MTVETPVAEFIARAGDLPYRDYVAHLMEGKSSEHLRLGGMEFAAKLPPACQKLTIEFIDAINDRFAHDRDFWRAADCHTAFGRIIQIGIQVYPIGPGIESEVDAYEDSNQNLAFNIFWVATMGFAYSASSQRAQRKFMGIKKSGWFG